MFLSIAFLAVALSLDALGIAVAYGMRGIRIPLPSKLLMTVFSVIYSAISLYAGSLLSSVLPPAAAKWIGIAILAFMGTWMILQGILKENDGGTESKTILDMGIKPLGITIKIIRNPLRCDLDQSNTIDRAEAVYLGLALSLDAISVGFASAMTGIASALVPLSIGLAQLVFLYAGLFLGSKLVKCRMINHRLLVVLPGILLLILAVCRTI